MLIFPRCMNSGTASVHYSDADCSGRLASASYYYLNTLNRLFDRDMVYLCIGTDRATGDCLGPLVGTLLRAYLPKTNVFGTLENPAHAVNLVDIVRHIEDSFRDPLVVAVDASLGRENRIGFISVQPGGLTPGTALQKTLPTVGDFHISAVVNVGGYLEQIVLQNTRLHIVYRMAEVIAQSLFQAHTLYHKDKTAGEVKAFPPLSVALN